MQGSEESSNRDIRSGSSVESTDESDSATLCQSGSTAADSEADDTEHSVTKSTLSAVAKPSSNPVTEATQEKGLNFFTFVKFVLTIPNRCTGRCLSYV